MTPLISKIILITFLLIIILGNLFAYRIKKLEKYHPYFYLNGTISIMCALIFLCFDTNLFSVNFDEKFYLITLLCCISANIIGTLIMLIIRLAIKNK